MISDIFLVGVCALLVYASATDIIRFRIQNAVPFSIVILFVAFAIANRMPMREVLMHLAAGGGVLAVTFALYASGLRFGGGDAKLLSAVALWCGSDKLIPLLVVTSLVGGGMGLAVLFVHRSGISGWATAHGLNLRVFTKQDGKAYIPYAVAIAAGFMLVAV